MKRRTPQSNTERVDGDFGNATLGEHEARLVYVADLGLHQDEYKGEKKPPAQKASLGLEIVDEDVQIGGEMQPRLMWVRPFNVFSTLTEKGRELEYYSVFDSSASPGDIPKWEQQLGKPCTVVVEHVEKDGNVYDNIKALRPIPAKYQDDVKENRLETGEGDADDEDNPVNQRLHGLAKWVFEHRLSEDEVENVNPARNMPERMSPDEIPKGGLPSDDFDDTLPPGF